jgi:23S rRNA pseudouridine1911/1915/1917 synthase
VKDKSLQRTYLAICEGIIDEKGTIDAPIGRADNSIITRQIDYDSGKYAITHYRRLKHGKKYSLVELKLETGRTHQIRVHLKHIGHPIIGDDIYNPDYSDINRHALHSYKLEFIHPITDKKMSITAPLPNDMASIIDI